RDDVRVRRISVERDSGADAHLEHAVTRPEIQALDNLMLAIDKNPAEEKIVEASQVGVDAAFMRLGHRRLPRVESTQEISAGRYRQRGDFASGRRVDSSQLTLDRSYIALAKSPLAAFLEGRNNTAPGKFVHRVRTQVEQERDFAGIQQYVVFIGHARPTRRLSSGILSGRNYVVCAHHRSQGKRNPLP